jgi:CheY-like chemotaxis protein/tRNA A-37 threonylcarbamoyl transferase component Bud32
VDPILIVDDNLMNRQIIAEQLSTRGHEVIEAAGGAEAIALVDSRPLEAVILDVMMPGIDGFTVLRRIRDRFSLTELPVIMATARDDRAAIVEALGMGANDYVTKPLDFAVVYARLTTHLALKRAGDEIRRLNQQIARLGESSADAVRDVETWSANTAGELAPVIGATSISVWLLEGISLWPLSDSDAQRPTLEELAIVSEMKLYVRDADTLFAVTGLSGDVYGALVVASKTRWEEPERRLVSSFARQLGSALEVQRMRNDLAAAQSRVAVRRQEMIDRGIDILHVCPKCGLCYGGERKRCGVDGSLLESPRLLPLTIRGRYRLMRAISSSGMAKLFEAADEKLGRSVALKLIKPEHFDDPEMRVRFELEARAVARIDHPGVVAIYDSGELEDGSLFFVMELLRGLNLGQVLHAHGPGSARQVASVVRQVGAALAAAHRAGFIHRDIKPDNIFLSDEPLQSRDDFRVKLLDFGIAKPIDSESQLTQTGAFIGTPGYMAPEQLLGLSVDVRADIYSLAASTFEALTGERVGPRKTGSGAKHELMRKLPQLRELMPDAPNDVDDAVMRALSIDPESRPSQVEAWANALALALEAMPDSVAHWPRPLVNVDPVKTDAKQLATLPSRRPAI